jgi:GNAT superfamily N-acetyltransferase
VAYRGLIDQAYLDGLDPAQQRERWGQGLARYKWPDRGTLVAEQDGQIIGFAHLSTGDEGEIHAIYVTPDAWGTGVGRALMDEALARLRDAGCTEVILWVLAANERARRFYEKAGWHGDGGEAPHDIGGVEYTVVRYRLRLAEAPSAK